MRNGTRSSPTCEDCQKQALLGPGWRWTLSSVPAPPLQDWQTETENPPCWVAAGMVPSGVTWFAHPALSLLRKAVALGAVDVSVANAATRVLLTSPGPVTARPAEMKSADDERATPMTPFSRSALVSRVQLGSGTVTVTVTVVPDTPNLRRWTTL